MKTRLWLLSTSAITSAIYLGSVGVAGAADLDRFGVAYGDLPAVSAVNGKLVPFIGSVSGDTAYGAAGAIALPVGHDFGVQVDGLLGTAGGGVFYGVGGHAFWRDPSKGLVGAYGSYVGWNTTSTVPASSPISSVFDVNGAEVGKLGVEGEAYLGRVSLEGRAGWQFGTKTGFAGRATVAFYPSDDLRLDLSARHLVGVGVIGGAGAEWAPSGGSYSLFADGALGGNDYSHVFGGIKVYFGGQDKSLIRRHREDDPDVTLPDDLFDVVGDTSHCPDSLPVLFDGACVVSPP